MVRLCKWMPFLHPHLLLPFSSFQRPLCPLPHLLFLLFIYSLTSCSSGVTEQTKDKKTHPMLGTIPTTTFTCVGHVSGYYADPETSCQVYHMCDTQEKQYSYLCPNHTLFNQKFLVCDHWYMVDCSSSLQFYSINNHTGEEVSDGSEGSSEEANTIPISAGGSDIRETSPKDTKSSSIDVTLKSPRPDSAKTRLPPVTQTTILQEPKRRVNNPSVTQTTKNPKRPVTSAATPANKRRLPQPEPGKPRHPPATHTTVTQPLTTQDLLKLSTPLPPRHISPQSVQGRKRSHSLGPNLSENFNNGRSRGVPAKSSVVPKTNVETDVSTNTTDTLSEPLNGETGFVGSRHSPPLIMMPASVARKPGNKFLFTRNTDKNPILKPINLQGVVFKPLVVRPEKQTLRISSSSAVPLVSMADQNTQHSTPATFPVPRAPSTSSSRSRSPVNLRERRILSAFQGIPALSPVSINLAPVLPASLQSGSPIKHHKQEFPTPLTTRGRYRNPYYRIFQTTPELQSQLPATRGNRDFFIPTPELSLPTRSPPKVDQNSLNETREHRSADEHHHHSNGKEHMTMVFPPPPETRMKELRLNPHCPRCHPALLNPGECRPCVIIR